MKQIDSKLIETFIEKGLADTKLEQPSMNFNISVLNKLSLATNKETPLLSKKWLGICVAGLSSAIIISVFLLFFGIEANTSGAYFVVPFNLVIKYLSLGYFYLTSQGAIIGYSIIFTLSILALIDQLVEYFAVSKAINSIK